MREAARRVFIEKTFDETTSEFQLSNDNNRYIRKVLRLSAGDKFEVVPCLGDLKYLCTLSDKFTHIDKAIKKKEIIGQRIDTLLFALCKPKATELMIEKATEHCVKKIIIWQSERSVPKVNNKSKKLERYKKIAVSAATQCERDYLPDILICSNIEDALSESSISKQPHYLCSLEDNLPILSSVIKKDSCVVIGPEGDLTEKEKKILLTKNVDLASLGNTILRSETAAISACALGWT